MENSRPSDARNLTSAPGVRAARAAGIERRRLAANGRRHSATREMVLRMVEAQSSPVSTAGLSAATGLHENTVRGHLDQLFADGYIGREREPAIGRGRPAWLWTASRPDPENPYASLAGVLADTLARGDGDPVPKAREAGRRWGSEIAARRAGRVEASDHPTEPDGAVHLASRAQASRRNVVDVMREQGFAPVDGGEDIILHRCPLIEAATRHPTIVCAVHQGMIDGILDADRAPLTSRLLPFSAPGQCTLQLQVAQ